MPALYSLRLSVALFVEAPFFVVALVVALMCFIFHLTNKKNKTKTRCIFGSVDMFTVRLLSPRKLTWFSCRLRRIFPPGFPGFFLVFFPTPLLKNGIRQIMFHLFFPITIYFFNWNWKVKDLFFLFLSKEEKIITKTHTSLITWWKG